MGLILSDVDGTLVHYPARRSSDDANQCSGDGTDDPVMLPPSSTGLRGCISRATLAHVQRLRAQGHCVVIVSGMRVSTFWQRRPFLPLCDGYAIENGGRLFWTPTGGAAPEGAALEEDLRWREVHNSQTGPPGQEDVSPSARHGTLWDVYRQCSRDGFTCDAGGYTTQFRVKAPSGDGRSQQRLMQLLSQLPAGLTSAFNLGCADIFPETSGKANVAKYVAQRFGLRLSDRSVVFLCDDDNDVDLAKQVGAAFVVSVTSPSMAAAIQNAPHGSFVTPPPGTSGTAATEAMLAAVEAHFQHIVSPA